MEIVLVIFFWLFVFAALGLIYLALRIFAKKYYVADVLKDTFSAFFGVALISTIFLFVITISNFCSDYFYPSRVFTKNFGFEPTTDVRIIESLSFWTPFGYSTHLKFQANKNTIEKISANGFPELTKSFIKHNGSIEAEEILAHPQSHYYHRKKSVDEVNSAYLVYDEQSQTAYFSLQFDD